MRDLRESPGRVMPLLGAAAGAIYGSTKEGEKHPLVFSLIGAGAGVFLGTFMGSMSAASESRVTHLWQPPGDETEYHHT